MTADQLAENPDLAPEDVESIESAEERAYTARRLALGELPLLAEALEVGE